MKTSGMPLSLSHRGPTLEVLQMVETVIRKSNRPLSLNRINALLPRKVMHPILREAIEHYKRLGCVTEGSKGLMRTLNPEPGFWNVVKTWGSR
jgi:hypothetical protein